MFQKYNRLPCTKSHQSCTDWKRFLFCRCPTQHGTARGVQNCQCRTFKHTRCLVCVIYKNEKYCYCCYSVIIMFQSIVAPKSPRAFSPAQTGKSFFILQLGSYAPPPFTAWNSQGGLRLPIQNIHARYLVCVICNKAEYCYYCYSVIMFSKYNRLPMQQESSALHRLEKVFILQMPYTAWNSQKCPGLPM